MNTLNLALRHEMRVAFSRDAQPVWFRMVKWTVILIGIALVHARAGFWWTFAGLAVAGMLLHFFYRWKTRTWKRAWGGWNDLAADRD